MPNSLGSNRDSAQDFGQALQEIAETKPDEKNSAAWSLVNTARRALGLPQIIVNPPRGWTP